MTISKITPATISTTVSKTTEYFRPDALIDTPVAKYTVSITEEIAAKAKEAQEALGIAYKYGPSALIEPIKPFVPEVQYYNF